MVSIRPESRGRTKGDELTYRPPDGFLHRYAVCLDPQAEVLLFALSEAQGHRHRSMASL